MPSTKHIELANRLTLFLLGLGLAAFWTASQQIQYQDRLVRYVYLDVLLGTVAMLERGDYKGERITRTDLCVEAGDTFSNCFGQGKEEQGATTTIQQTGWAKPSHIKDSLVDGVTLVKQTGTRWNSRLEVRLLLVPIPHGENANARAFVQRLITEDEKDAIRSAFYVDFNDAWWPAILIKVGPSATDWLIVQSDWSNLWFIKSRPYGMNFAPLEMDWTSQFPETMRDRIRSFATGYYPVTLKDIEYRAQRDAEKIQSKRAVTMTLDEAMSVIINKPKADIKVPGIPEAADLIIWLLPFLFCYSALLLRSAVYTWTAAGSVDDEPWFILNGKSGIEILFSLLACVALLLSGIAVLWLVAASDLQASVLLARLQHWFTGEQDYNLLERTLRESYDSSRDSGTPYFERIPLYLCLAIVAIAVGMIAIALSSNKLLRRYSERSVCLHAILRATPAAMLAARKWLVPDEALRLIQERSAKVASFLMPKATNLKEALKRILVACAFSRRVWAPLALIYVFGLVISFSTKGSVADLSDALVMPKTPVSIEWLGRVLVPFELVVFWGLIVRRRVGARVLWAWAFVAESISSGATIVMTLLTASGRSMAAYIRFGTQIGRWTDIVDIAVVVGSLLMWLAMGLYVFGGRAIWTRHAKPLSNRRDQPL